MRLLSNCLRTGDPPKNWFEAFRWELRADAYSTHCDSVPEYVFHQVKNAAENAWDDLRRR
jgi:hypothetical protein